jgi:hypothetical protein
MAINFERELTTAGSMLNRNQFYDLVSEIFGAFSPSWTPDELACHPAEALQFCQAVRVRAGGEVPDHIIMHALMNARKRPEG